MTYNLKMYNIHTTYIQPMEGRIYCLQTETVLKSSLQILSRDEVSSKLTLLCFNQ